MPSFIYDGMFMHYLSDLHAGRAGEHLVAADLLRHGIDCFHSAQGMPYDLVADYSGRLVRVQVKTTRRPERLPGRGVDRYAYRFWVSRCGKGGKGRYTDAEIDLFALVGLDDGEIGYVHVSQMARTLFVRPARLRGEHCDEKIVARNAEIYALLCSGMPVDDVCARFGIERGYAYKIRAGKARTHIPGVYMSDYSLESALGCIGIPAEN